MLSLVIVALIAWEIDLSYKGMGAARQELRLLQDNLATATAQAKTLDAIVEAQKTSIQAMSSMSEAMHKQLAILAADQKRRLADVAKKPRLLLLVGGIPLDQPRREFFYRQLTTSKAVLEVVLFNKGDAPARLGVLRVYADKAEVRLQCDVPFTELHAPAGLPGRAILVPFERLGESTWVLMVLTAEYPVGFGEFTVGFNVDGENLPRTMLGSVTVQPPKQL